MKKSIVKLVGALVIALVVATALFIATKPKEFSKSVDSPGTSSIDHRTRIGNEEVTNSMLPINTNLSSQTLHTEVSPSAMDDLKKQTNAIAFINAQITKNKKQLSLEPNSSKRHQLEQLIVALENIASSIQ